jgi:hypothetical protein
MAGAVAALALLALLYYVNADTGFAHTTATTGLGWLVPLIAGIVSGGVAWALLVSRPADDGARPIDRCRCAVCGGTVLGDWRLCPHCGERLSGTGIPRVD